VPNDWHCYYWRVGLKLINSKERAICSYQGFLGLDAEAATAIATWIKGVGPSKEGRFKDSEGVLRIKGFGNGGKNDNL